MPIVNRISTKQKISLLFFIAQKSFLIIKSLYFYLRALPYLKGKEFDTFGRKSSLLLLGKTKFFISWLCNPVSIVRYFEVSFCHNSVNWQMVNKYLDVSSPRLFFVYLVKQYTNLSVEAINPDHNDLEDTREIVQSLGISDRINLSSENAIRLSYPDNYFDVITTISVIEHIPDNGDQMAIKELWRVLKPKGKLIITIPCMKQYQEEWREHDIYQLGNPQKDQKYFFQRFYDEEALQSRLIDVIQVQPKIVQVFGEKQSGIFFEYERKWIKYGLEETIKDPLHITQDYKMFPSIDCLSGVGVCGLVFEKKD